MMHRPDRNAMACWTSTATPRWWLATGGDHRAMRQADVDASRLCRAFATAADRQNINGTACDGCARIPEDQR